MSSIQESGSSTSVQSVAPPAVEEPSSQQPDTKLVTDTVTDISSKAVRETPSEIPATDPDAPQWSDEGGIAKHTDGNGQALIGDQRTQTSGHATEARATTEDSSQSATSERRSQTQAQGDSKDSGDTSAHANEPTVVVMVGDSPVPPVPSKDRASSTESPTLKSEEHKSEQSDSKTKTEVMGESKTGIERPSDSDQPASVDDVEKPLLEDDLPPKYTNATKIGQQFSDLSGSVMTDVDQFEQRATAGAANANREWDTFQGLYQAPAPAPAARPTAASTAWDNLMGLYKKPAPAPTPAPAPAPAPASEKPIQFVPPLSTAPAPAPAAAAAPGSQAPSKPTEMIPPGPKPSQISFRDASRTMADYMGSNGIDAVNMNDLYKMAADPKSPPKLAAAAEFFIKRPEAYKAVETNDVKGVDGRSGLANFKNAADGKIGIPPTRVSQGESNSSEAHSTLATYMRENKLEGLSFNDLYKLATKPVNSKDVGEVNKARSLADAAAYFLERPQTFKMHETRGGAAFDGVLRRDQLPSRA
jgi:hypothetical protein